MYVVDSLGQPDRRAVKTKPDCCVRVHPSCFGNGLLSRRSMQHEAYLRVEAKKYPNFAGSPALLFSTAASGAVNTEAAQLHFEKQAKFNVRLPQHAYPTARPKNRTFWITLSIN